MNNGAFAVPQERIYRESQNKLQPGMKPLDGVIVETTGPSRPTPWPRRSLLTRC